MEDPENVNKAAKFRGQFLDQNGKLINCSPGDKLFIETRVTLSAEPSAQNFPLFVKSVIKTISNNVVTISDVEIVGEFRDQFKNGIIKNLDLSRFSSQFRNKTFKLTADGSWALAHSGVPSGISRIQFQEDLPKSIGLSTELNNDETAQPQQDLSELQKVADSLKKFDLSTTELESVYEVINNQDLEIQCVVSIKDVIRGYSEQQTNVDETLLKYIWILQVVAERFGSSLLPNTEQSSVSSVVDGLGVDKIETLH